MSSSAPSSANTVTGYKISLKLFEDETAYFEDDYDRLATQVHDHFQWAIDILMENNKWNYDRFESLIKNDAMTPGIVANIRNNRRKMADKELGEYVKKNGLHKDFIEGLSYTFDMLFDNFTMASSFDVDTATIHITLTDVQDRGTHSADMIMREIIHDSLEDGIYEGCYDEGKGFDIYEKQMINVKAINSALNRFGCLKGRDELKNPDMLLSVHCGIIDYRKNENIIIEEIRSD